MLMIEPETTATPRIEEVEAQGAAGRFEIQPLAAGYGVTLGNALRRVLLSSLEGAAVTSIQVANVYHEFSTIPAVKEDVTQIVLNMKKIRLRSFAPHPVTLKLAKHGAGLVTAGDIAESADVEIVNPELELLTLDSDAGSIDMDITVETGVGYRVRAASCTALAKRGLSARTRSKSPFSRMNRSQLVTARTVAVRGCDRSSAMSPKNAPSPSVATTLPDLSTTST